MKYKISDELTGFQLLRFAMPTLLMMVVVSVYTIVDGLFVARFVSAEALAALNIGYPLIMFLGASATMFGTGGSAFVSHRMGMKRQLLADKAFTLILCALTFLSAIYCIICIIFLDELAYLLGANDLLLSDVKAYIYPMLLFGIFFAFQWMFSCFFVAADKPSLGFYLTIIGGLINIIFDYVFIVIFEFGVAGAAYATVMSWIIPSFGGFVFFYKNRNGLHFRKPHFHLSILTKSMFNGSSEMVGQLSQLLTMIAFNILMMKYLGADGVASITAALYFSFLVNSAVIGFSLGVAPVISYHHGARNIVFLRLTIRRCFTIVVIMSILAYGFSYFYSNIIAGLFFEQGTDVIALASHGLGIYALSFLFVGINFFASALFTALGNGLVSGIIAFCRSLLFALLCIFSFSYFWQAEGLWFAIPMAELLTIFVVIFYLYSLRKKHELI